jgi:uncharacterized phiE125 gp8 family phage protein
MNLKVVTGPTIEPVSLAAAKLHLRVDHDDEDTLITSKMLSARLALESICRRAFLTQTLEMRLDEFPGRRFELPYPPLQSISSIKYVDSDNVEHTVANTSYGFDAYAEPGIVYLRDGYSWPGVSLIAVGGFRVQYVAGWTAAEAVPETIKNAILLLTGQLYENREETVVAAGLTKVSMGVVEDLIRNDRIYGW